MILPAVYTPHITHILKLGNTPARFACQPRLSLQLPITIPPFLPQIDVYMFIFASQRDKVNRTKSKICNRFVRKNREVKKSVK